GRWPEWGRRWLWLSSSSCKLWGAMVVEVWQLSGYHIPTACMISIGFSGDGASDMEDGSRDVLEPSPRLHSVRRRGLARQNDGATTGRLDGRPGHAPSPGRHGEPGGAAILRPGVDSPVCLQSLPGRSVLPPCRGTRPQTGDGLVGRGPGSGAELQPAASRRRAGEGRLRRTPESPPVGRRRPRARTRLYQSVSRALLGR